MTKAEQEWSLIEALEYCKDRESGSCVSCPYPGLDCAIDIAIAKLEAQEPRPPIIKENSYGWKFYYCPSCGKEFYQNNKFNFCEKCGQRISWDDRKRID